MVLLVASFHVSFFKHNQGFRGQGEKKKTNVGACFIRGYEFNISIQEMISKTWEFSKVWLCWNCMKRPAMVIYFFTIRRIFIFQPNDEKENDHGWNLYIGPSFFGWYLCICMDLLMKGIFHFCVYTERINKRRMIMKLRFLFFFFSLLIFGLIRRFELRTCGRDNLDNLEKYLKSQDGFEGFRSSYLINISGLLWKEVKDEGCGKLAASSRILSKHGYLIQQLWAALN